MKIKWWGYKHTNGTIQVKRYFSLEDLIEADELSKRELKKRNIEFKIQPEVTHG